MDHILDVYDEEILDLLIENSRITYKEISNRINLSSVAVRNRVKNLEKNGIIERYTVILNPEKIGHAVSVFFDIEVEPFYLNDVIDSLTDNSKITDLYLMTGSGKLHVHAVLGKDESLGEFVTEFLYKQKGIKEINSEMILNRYKMREGFRL